MEKRKAICLFLGGWLVAVNRKGTSFTGFDPLNTFLILVSRSEKILPPIDRNRGFC